MITKIFLIAAAIVLQLRYKKLKKNYGADYECGDFPKWQ